MAGPPPPLVGKPHIDSFFAPTLCVTGATNASWSAPAEILNHERLKNLERERIRTAMLAANEDGTSYDTVF